MDEDRPENKVSITPDIITAHAKCPLKSYYLLTNREQGARHEYLSVLEEESCRVLSKYLDRLKRMHPTASCDLFSGVRTGAPAILEPLLEFEDLRASPVALIRKDRIDRMDGSSRRDSSEETHRYYAPVLAVGTTRISKDHKLHVAFMGHVLSKMGGARPIVGFLVTSDGTIRRVGLEDLYTPIVRLIKSLRSRSGTTQSEPPYMILNKECPYCPFQPSCEATARKQDHLSLLKGMGAKEIKAQNKKGIFTVTQLSYTYRPRKQRKGNEKRDPKHSFALKALAIRDNTIYVVKQATAPASSVRIYLDVEGIPDRGFYYLVGLCIAREGRDLQRLSYWAPTQCDEESIWRSFLSTIEQYGNFTLFHYGSYESRFINDMTHRYSRDEDNTVLARLKANSINLLSLIYSRYYFPTYSNGLKDIAKYLGHKWTVPDATGLTSLVWRYMWESTHQDGFREKLAQYNWEDCLALKLVTEAVLSTPDKVEDGKPTSPGTQLGTVRYKGVPDTNFQYTHPQFCEFKSPIEHFEEINKYAYFDYQRSHVYLRTNKKLQRLLARQSKGKTKKVVHRANRVVRIPLPKQCNRCGRDVLQKHSRFSHSTIDLRFAAGGVRRWVTRYAGQRCLCVHCGCTTKPKDGKDIDKYGDGIAIWTTNQFITHRMNLNTIKNMLADVFEIELSTGTLHNMKKVMSKKYTGTVAELLDEIVSGSLIHADETQVKVAGFSSPYVWVLANMDTVVYLFRPNREVDHLKTLLCSFKGILVSDFYPGYESLPCLQQKCLIHLIRDLNSDFLCNQFDFEYKSLVTDFSDLLNEIMSTVNRRGLRSRYLRKHIDAVQWFFKKRIDVDGDTELTRKWQKRFQKNWDVLFTFLSYDNCPWNNNNAEHAITPFARHRRIRDVEFTEKSIAEYLTLLSVQQTCKYRGISFLTFLQSCVSSLKEYSVR